MIYYSMTTENVFVSYPQLLILYQQMSIPITLTCLSLLFVSYRVSAMHR